MKTLVIGYGNALRHDDGVGPFVAERLEECADLRVIVCHQLTPELAEPVSQADRVIFVDAHTEVRAGEIAVLAVAPSESALIHQQDAGTLLDWARKLYGRAPEALMVGIGGEMFELGEGLSPAGARAARAALRAIRELVRQPSGRT